MQKQYMLLTPPRSLDISLGVGFIILNSVAYVCSYYFMVCKEDSAHVQHMNFLLVLYGYLQSLIGFTAGIWLARITQVSNTDQIKPVILDEEMMLIEPSPNTCTDT